MLGLSWTEWLVVLGIVGAVYDGNDQDPALGDTRYWVEVNKDGSAVEGAGD